MTKDNNHQIDLQSLMKTQSSCKVLFSESFRNNQSKAIYMTCRNSYEVHVDGDLVFESIQPFAAVEKYNNLKL